MQIYRTNKYYIMKCKHKNNLRNYKNVGHTLLCDLWPQKSELYFEDGNPNHLQAAVIG